VPRQCLHAWLVAGNDGSFHLQGTTIVSNGNVYATDGQVSHCEVRVGDATVTECSSMTGFPIDFLGRIDMDESESGLCFARLALIADWL